MAEDKDQEKTEPATEKKRREARKKGQIAQSREIPSVFVLLSSLSVFYFAGAWMFYQLTEIMRAIFHQMAGWTAGIEDAHAIFWYLAQKMALLLAPLVTVAAVAGIAGNISQSGFLIIDDAFIPKFSKLNPFSGIKRIFSLRGLVELVKSLFKLAIIGGISYRTLKGEMDAIPALVDLDVSGILAFLGRVALKMGFFTCLALIVLAGLDFAFQRWKHERDLRMTKQEVKDEHKQREGDPAVRARIRSAQRQMAMRRMMQAVPEATVVITNPTHLAVAMKFDRSMPAPMVVAKGADHVAGRIREIAEQKGIPIIEQKPLARVLYKDVDVGQYIPVELYQAVAEVLAYVYRLKGLVRA
ncbi:MAG: flagellar biosynthesis protein FlhB [Desulfobacteraceae bacterium]|nr:MAG: flagellar biosynthesis protein FlhB [Desulfobacteraceae bacterium]